MSTFISFNFNDLQFIFHDMKSNFSEWEWPGWQLHMAFHPGEVLFTMWDSGCLARRHA
jgi:hypothetical protein